MVYRQMSQEPLELLETVRLGLPRLKWKFNNGNPESLKKHKQQLFELG